MYDLMRMDGIVIRGTCGVCVWGEAGEKRACQHVCMYVCMYVCKQVRHEALEHYRGSLMMMKKKRLTIVVAIIRHWYLLLLLLLLLLYGCAQRRQRDV